MLQTNEWKSKRLNFKIYKNVHVLRPHYKSSAVKTVDFATELYQKFSPKHNIWHLASNYT